MTGEALPEYMYTIHLELYKYYELKIPNQSPILTNPEVYSKLRI